ncbi:uncharacterized protein LOC135805649 [Sycon ciliatum]|uniref:uncharacterized protein LOC135805649 n=1 Tax=Sycon ciliatum TaxID=27933 RepID=UPI0031F68B14|eukprot:scpid23150/ scgid31130/ 
MSIIEEELSRFRKDVAEHVPGSEVVCCVRSSVQVRLRRTDFKTLVVQAQFPADYPAGRIVVELKSKTIPTKFLDGLVSACDAETKKLLGQKQLLPVVKFVRAFMDENPLMACSDELSHIRKDLVRPSDEIKVNRKAGTIVMRVVEGNYATQFKLIVPDNYPADPVKMELKTSSLPSEFQVYMAGQSEELARQCVQPPLRPKPRAPPFTPAPSLRRVATFLVMECARVYPMTCCPLCKARCFPDDPARIVEDLEDAQHIERILCNHLYHRKCLDDYMKTPPFKGGKKCKAKGCEQRIFHERWNVSEKLAEDRWAHQEAKRREIDEVVEFLGV